MIDLQKRDSSVWTERLSRLADRAAEEGLAAVIVASDWRYKGNLRYFTDRVLWSRWAYLVVRPEQAPVLIMVSPSQKYWAEQAGTIEDVRFAHHDPVREVIALLEESVSPDSRVGIAGESEIIRPADLELLRRELPGVEFTDASPLVQALRKLKTADEIEAARHTMQIAEEAYALFCDRLAPGVSGWDLVGDVERILRGSGSYDTMILLSTGPYLREPAAQTFKSGDCVMFSIELAGPEGYWVERGGTLFIGEPDDSVRRLYKTCFDALEVAESLLTPGQTAATVAQRVGETLAASEFEQGIWGGHGIGLDVLEPPILLPGRSETIDSNSLVAYHPHVVDPANARGAYISDTYIVTDEETIPLAQIPHELTCVPA